VGEKVKVGVIGTGQIGKHHIGQYMEIEDAEIVAVADLNGDEAKRVAEENGIGKYVTDYRELLAMDEIVAVDVCLHNNLHAPVAIEAMQAGKDVYSEKPLAGSFPDAEKMYNESVKLKRKLAMQLVTLFSKEAKAAKRLVDEGHLGKVYYAKSSAYRRRGRPYVDGYGSSAFVQKEIAAGGALYDMGVYHICQMLYLMGAPDVLTVSGATHQEIDMYEDRRKSGKYSVEELGLGFVRLAGGISFYIEESWAIHLQGTDGSKLVGSKGGLTLSPFSYHTTMSDMAMDATFDLQSADTRWHRCIENTDAYDSPQKHWVAALQGRVELVPSARLGLLSMLISEGIYLSQKLGREVSAQDIAEQSASTAVDPHA